MQLDCDDLFINENIFNICYEEVKKNNIYYNFKDL